LLTSAGRNSLLLAWLERSIATGPTVSLQHFQQTLGLDLFVDVLQPVLSRISSLKFKPGRGGDSTESLKSKVMLYSAAMRLSATTATVFGDEGRLSIEKVCLLIKHTIPKEPFQGTNGGGIDLAVLRDQHSILNFEVLNLLGCIGKAIPSVCTERVLRTIRRAFASFLSSEDWAESSFGISSVISFGSELNAAHQHILPLCLSKASMGLFQARASGQIWRGTDSDGNPSTSEESVFEVVDRMARQLYRCTSPTATATATATIGSQSQRILTVRDILPSTTTISTIAPGSYVLEMPTQEDRNAMVIFPPGPQSLQDIRYMLGMDDDAEVPTQRLKRAIATPRGGFKILLVSS